MKLRVMLLGAVVVVVLLACESLLGATVARRRQDVDAQRIVLERTRGQVADTQAALERSNAAFTKTNKTTADRIVEQRRARVAVERARQALAAVNRDLGHATAESHAAGQTVAGIQACVNATNAATAAHTTLNGTNPVDILQAAQAQCEQRLVAGDPEAPVFPFDFADPSVLRVDNTYYAYSTNGAFGNIQVISSPDLEHWTIVGDAMPFLAKWASPNGTWAPAIERIGDRYLAYYTARETATFLECIGVAASSSPTGPFFDLSPKPLICQQEGSIDPRSFVDGNGHATLVWKNQAGPGLPTQIWSQALTPDGTKTTGPAAILAKPDREWEHGVVEAPTLVEHDGTLVLFYSGGNWSTDEYTLGAARCDSPAGPCHKAADPVLTSHGTITGPGSADFVTGPDDSLWMLYSAFRAPHVGYPSSRLLRRSKVDLTRDHVAFSAH